MHHSDGWRCNGSEHIFGIPGEPKNMAACKGASEPRKSKITQTVSGRRHPVACLADHRFCTQAHCGKRFPRSTRTCDRLSCGLAAPIAGKAREADWTRIRSRRDRPLLIYVHGPHGDLPGSVPFLSRLRDITLSPEEYFSMICIIKS